MGCGRWNERESESKVMGKQRRRGNKRGSEGKGVR